MIELKQVTFQYENAPESVYSVHNVDLTIQNGECVVLCGRSGCGKTTITRLINGLIPHYYEGNLSGHISVDGTEIKNQQLSKISQHVGSVFQNPRSQFFNVDTTSELAFGCENQGLPKEDVLRRIAEAANRFSLNGLLNRSIFELSGGEKQRTAVARAVITEPRLILADEPTGALDSHSSQQLLNIFDRLNEQGQTLLMVTHSSLAASHARRVLFIRDGKLFAELCRGDQSQQVFYDRITASLSMATRQGGESL